MDKIYDAFQRGVKAGTRAEVARVSKEDPTGTDPRPGAIRPVKETIEGADPSETWYGPGQVITPVAPSAAGRRYAYQVGTNYNYMPRAGEGMDFPQLRNFGDACGLYRIAVGHMKDQLMALPWEIVSEGTEPSTDDQKKRIEALTTAFQFPDRERDFPTWLGMVFEDTEVIDAPTILAKPSAYAETLNDGELIEMRKDPTRAPDLVYSFDQIDGATIKILQDPEGKRPVFPDPAYYRILYGTNAALLTTFDMLYMPREPRVNKAYGFPSVEQIVLFVTASIRKDYSTVSYFTKGAIPDGLLTAPVGWKPAAVMKFMENFNAALQGNPNKWHQMWMVPGSYVPTKQLLLKTEQDEWLARLICLKTGVDPNIFLESARFNQEGSKATATDVGLSSRAVFLQRLITCLFKQYLGQRDLRFKFQISEQIDPEAKARADEIEMRTGLKSLDAALQERGRDTVGVGAGVWTSTGTFIPVAVLKEASTNGKVVGPDGRFIDPNEPAPAPQLGPGLGEDDWQRVERAARARGKKVLRPPQIRGAAQAEEKLTRKVLAFLQDRKDPTIAEVLAKYETGAAKIKRDDAPTGLTDAEISEAVQQVLDELNLQGWTVVRDDLAESILEVAKLGGAASLKQVKVDNPETFLAVNERAQTYAQKRSAELVGKKWIDGELVDNPDPRYSISEATREAVRGDIVDAFESGWTRDQLKVALEDNYAFSPYRAQLISQTELNFAASAGIRAGWSESKVVKRKGWLLSADHNEPETEVCSINAAAGLIPIDDPFPSGDDMPPGHPGCICTPYGETDERYEEELDLPPIQGPDLE